MNILLSGVVGSTAYGLAREGSDVDRLGVYAVDTIELHGLRGPKESHVTTNPDQTLHEAGKWARLALGCNPTAMELVWLDSYEAITPLGYELIQLRKAFLSAKRVRDAYLGYATQQFKKLESRGDGTFGPDLAHRTAKHARHMYRLLAQGLELWLTSELTIKVANPSDVMDFGEMVAEGDLRLARETLASYESEFNNTPTMLPDTPDEASVEAWLHKVRAEYLSST